MSNDVVLSVKNLTKIFPGKIPFTALDHLSFDLHEGEILAEIDDPLYRGKQVKLSYNKRQFYDRILTPMKSMGLIDYDLYKKHYKISDKFNKAMIKIGILWMQELRRPAQQLNLKKKDIDELSASKE